VTNWLVALRTSINTPLSLSIIEPALLFYHAQQPANLPIHSHEPSFAHLPPSRWNAAISHSLHPEFHVGVIYIEAVGKPQVRDSIRNEEHSSDPACPGDICFEAQVRDPRTIITSS